MNMKHPAILLGERTVNKEVQSSHKDQIIHKALKEVMLMCVTPHATFDSDIIQSASVSEAID